jgi:hypothetical protein
METIAPDDIRSWEAVRMHIAFGPPGLLLTFGEPGVEPVESTLRLANSLTRVRGGRRALPTLVYALDVTSEDLEERAEALGLSREVSGATLHLLGPRLDPDELLDGLGEWVREGGLVLILDASQADTDEIEALAPLLRDFSTERSIYTVLFLPALDAVTQEEGGNDVGRAGYPRTGDRAACGAQAQAALPDTVGAEAAGRGAEAGERVQRRERRNYAETPSLPAWQRDALPARQPWAAQGHAQQGEPRDE